ncbi:MAG: helix-turn-helix transcriptional regulator [Pseudohongiella sp.]|nr:helix-turn-helix transcriptional regulator [Pseudohongiella sp.]
MASKIDFKVAPPDTVLQEIGVRVASARLQQNITQAELAEKSGIAVRTLRRLEAGRGGSIDTLIRLLQALGQADLLDVMLPQAGISPMEAIRTSGRNPAPRSRARKKAAKTTSSWSWDKQETP